MPQPSAICVYCGANSGSRPEYADLARAFGTELARRGICLVYGGGKVGLMGVLADAALAGGGTVIGVIPRQLVEHERAHAKVSEMYIVETMHQRKTRMSELADAYVALPGGFGTMDEIFEMMTWAQLDLHQHPCAFLETRDYYRALRDMLDHMADEDFLSRDQRNSVWFGDSIPALFAWFERYDASGVTRLKSRQPVQP